MSRERVLAAAAALRTFSAAQLAAYCDEDEQSVRKVLELEQDLFARDDPGRWRVVDGAAIVPHAAAPTITRAPRGSYSGPVASGQVLEARLLLAENKLVDVIDEESRTGRKILVATALNHIRQVVAAALPDEPPWWDVSLPNNDAIDAAEGPDASVKSLLKSVLAVARLASAEANETPLRIQDLAAVTSNVTSIDRSGVVELVIELAHRIATGGQGGQKLIPTAQLLAGIAFRRARAWARDDKSGGCSALQTILSGMASDLPTTVDGRPAGLYRELSSTPEGHFRVAVYRDLLQVVPRQFQCVEARSIFPGAIVEAITDSRTKNHLRACAETLEADLRQSPFCSESALIGQTAHIFEDLAQRSAELDATVIARSEETRADLLTLVDVR
jgi:hypothetical protein